MAILNALLIRIGAQALRQTSNDFKKTFNAIYSDFIDFSPSLCALRERNAM